MASAALISRHPTSPASFVTSSQAQSWEPGSTLTLVLRASGDGSRTAVAFESDPSEAPSLQLEYTPGP